MNHPLANNDPHPLLTRVLDLLLDAICVVDAEGRFVFVSAACERLFGYTQAELVGRNMIELVHPDDREATLQTAADIMRGRPYINFENRYLHKDGRVVNIMWSARWSESDRVRIAVARDVTGLKRDTRIQAATFRIMESSCSSDDLMTLFQRIHEVIESLLPASNFRIALYDQETDSVSFPWFVDTEQARPAAHPLGNGNPLAEIIRSGSALFTSSGNGADWLGVPLISERGIRGAIILRRSDTACRYTAEDRDMLQFLSPQITTAIERKQMEARLHHLAWHDALTGLPNRTLFQDRFDMALKQARREGEHVALLYLDLDGFKEINDQYGHDVGDSLLREVAARLQQCLREVDSIGRRGGDEFTILLPNIRESDILAMVRERVLRLMSLPFLVNGHRLTITASIGTAIYPEHGTEKEQLFRHADASMYATKRREI